MARAYELSYDLSKIERGYYYDQELIAEYFGIPVKEVYYLGTGRAGHVYQVNGKNFVVITDFDSYDFETRKGIFKFRRYTGSKCNLSKHDVVMFNIAAGGLE